MLAHIFLIVHSLFNFDSSQWKIKNYTIKDGLSSNRVYGMVQDNNGRYWIASNAGLAYFDGYNFTYLTSENGVKSVDLIDIYYVNNHIYIIGVSTVEAINIKNLSRNYATKLYPQNIALRFGVELINNKFIYYYHDSVDVFENLELKTYKNIELPLYNKAKSKFESLIDLNPEHKKETFTHVNDIFSRNLFYSSFNILRRNEHGKLVHHFTIPLTSKGFAFATSIDSNYFLLDYPMSDKYEIYSRKLNQSRELFKGVTPLSFDLYKENGFYNTTFKDGIFLYSLKAYSKNSLDQFSYPDFHNQRSFLLENKLNEFCPAIKKQGQMYSFCHYGKWITYPMGIKSLIKLDTENFIIGRRDGTYFFNVKENHTKTPKFIDSSWVLRLRKMDAKLFILTYDNFKLLQGNTKKIFKLKFKGGYVLVNDLEYFNNQYVLGTNDQGVFISDSGFKKFKHISEKDGLQSKLVKRIKTDKQGNIWVLNDKGVDRINADLSVTRIFSIAEIDDYDIENFSVSRDSLWLFTDNTVYSLNYANRFKEKKIPIVLNTLTVDNDTKFYEADTNIFIGPRWETIKINYAGIYLHEQDHIVYKYRIVRDGDTGSWQKTKSNLLTLAALKSGNYLVQIQAFHNIYPNIHSEILHTHFIIKPYFYQTWWFYSLMGLLILAAVVGFLYFRNQIKLRELRLESELNKYKLHGLQNQMNPHFIFNSMSTIQNLILNNDNKHALDFISDFSTLMRTMLQNSRNDEISLVNELDFLKKYIHLEKVRYKDSFEFKIDIKIDEFDLEDIYIPTMMVQPLLENAVKHGISNLSDKSGLIILDLSFENKNENLLCIQIIDNGLGMSHKQIRNHSSTALNVIQERLAIYSKNGIFGTLNINYTEKGTTCILKIPV